MANGLAMGEYGAFVWGAYGITLSVLILNVVWARFQRKQYVKKLFAFFQRQSQ